MRLPQFLTGCFVAGFSFMCSFCAPYREPECVQIPQEERELDATVVLLNADSKLPNCSAFSVIGQDGAVVLVTAAHCVRKKVDPFDVSPEPKVWANIGDEIWYETRDSIFRAKSTIKSLDDPRDRAVLAVYRNEAPNPLRSIRFCDSCSFDGYPVHAVSSVFGWTVNSGIVTRRAFSGEDSFLFESTMGIDFGWSGSPVIGEDGTVVGIVTRCDADPYWDMNGKKYEKCRQHGSWFTSLP